MVEPDALSMLPSESTTPQLQEAILKEPSRAIRAVEDIVEGHSLEKYYCAHISRVQKMILHQRRTVETENLLQPSLSGDPLGMVKKDQTTGEFSCVLLLHGSFLQIEMAEGLNDFGGLPFTVSSTITGSRVRLCQ